MSATTKDLWAILLLSSGNKFVDRCTKLYENGFGGEFDEVIKCRHDNSRADVKDIKKFHADALMNT